MTIAAERSGSSAREAAQPEQRRLTGNQERFWFLDQYESDSSVLNLSCVLDVRGDWSDARVVEALQSTVARHPVLRQRFFATPTGPRCAAAAESTMRIDAIDAATVDGAALEKIVRSCLDAPLDLQSGVSVSTRLIRAPGRRLLCLVAHPCVADARSMRIVAEEIVEELRSDTDGRSSPPMDYAYFERAELSSEDLVAAERYWTDRIGVDPVPLELPRRGIRLARKQFTAHSVTLSLPASVIDAVDLAAGRMQTAFANVCFAAYLALLRRWSQQETVHVGRVADNRSSSEIRSVGPFENLLPVRADFQTNQSFVDFVRDMDAHLARDRQYESCSFDRIAKTLQKSRDPSRNPVFQAMFHCSDVVPLHVRSGNWSVAETSEFERFCAPYDLTLEVARQSDSGAIQVLFDAELFEPMKMQRFGDHYLRMLTAVADDPETLLDCVSILDDEEEHRQLEVLNPVSTRASERTVVDLFRSTAQRTPNAPAVSFDDTTLSYEAFDRQTDAMAASLRGRGVIRDVCVGVCLNRSIDMVATVLAILKAGGAYVPMDPSYPAERLAAMAQDSHASFIVARAREAPNLKTGLPQSTYVLPYEDLIGASRSDGVPENQSTIDSDALAYVIFTSGSTGRPKGVAMPHRALANLIEWQLARETFRPEARVLQYSSLSFDVSFQELFSTWASGGHLHLISDDDRRDPRRLLDALDQQEIERLFLPYVALRQLVEVARATQRSPTSLREVITAGEQLRVDDTLRAFFRSLSHASLDNQYGPSETHVVTAHLLEGDPAQWPELPPIGVPIWNNQALILDAHRQLLPEGVSGELFLAGVNLARGYIGRDDLTNERFVPHPFDSGHGSLAYRTGDVARYDSDGAIQFLGRVDHQVKIRGYRIEPGEVSAVLSRFPGVKQCLTTALDGGAQGKRLVAYLLVDDPEVVSTADVLKQAREHLPEFMVPAAIVAMAAFPFTPSGKVDVRSLPLPMSTATARPTSMVPPATPTQTVLAELWRKLLNLDCVGIRDSFFDLGGDSLMAVQVFLEIERRFGQDLPLSLLAENPTIESLARIIDAGGTHDLSQYRSLRVIQRGDAAIVPLFMIHGGGGNVVLFRDLAENLGKRQPVYAFEWDGWSNDRGQKSIEEMARLYAAELVRFQPDGVIRLGGHCIGGLIAIEVAGILRSMNRVVVDPLIVTDAPNLASSTHRDTVPQSADGAAFDQLNAMRAAIDARVSLCPPAELKAAPYVRPARTVLAQRVARLVGRVHRLTSKSKFNRAGIEDWVDERYIRSCLLFGLRMPKELRARYCALTMVHAARTFRSGGYDGDMLFFRTKTLLGQQMGLPGWWTDPYFGFDELCRGKFDAHFVNSEHNEVVRHQKTAEMIRDLLGNGSTT